MRSMAGTSAGGRSVDGLTRDDLQTRKDALMEELRGLEAERSKLATEAFDARWADTLDRAAMALRGLDCFELAPIDTAEIAREVNASVEGVTFGRVGWGAAVVLFFAVLGFSLSQATKPRDAGGSMTGATVDQGQAKLDALEARLDKDPQDLEAAAELAHTAIRSGDLEAGMKYVEAGRKVAPEDPRIKSSLAALMLAIGYTDRAEGLLDTVINQEPTLARAWLWRGVLYSTKGDAEQARAAFRKVLELSDDPEDRRLAAAMMADTVPEEPAAVTPPRARGHVRLADGASAPQDALVFVYARRSADGSGPPLAALKLPASSLPLDFELGDKDIIMQGVTWPDEVWLSARIDTDGNAMTHDEGAPESAPLGPVSSSDPVELILQ